MLTIPTLALIIFLVFLRVKWGNVHGGDMFLGCCLGLGLATTALGPPAWQGITSLVGALGQGLSGAFGA